jgi:fucose 4-O-acetylase-like acetyltransferase
LGLLEYPSGMILPWLAPVWIIALWAGFATLLPVSLRWLLGRWRTAALFGAVGGPLAYYAGMKLGAVSFPDPVVALAALAGGWAVLTPLTCWIALKLSADPPGLPKPAASPQLL